MTGAKCELVFTLCRNNLKTVRHSKAKSCCKTFMPKKCTFTLRIDKSRFKSVENICFYHFRVFTRCHFQNVPVRVPSSKSTVFTICRQKMCRFRVEGRPISYIFHHFQNLPASCERSLSVTYVSGTSQYKIRFGLILNKLKQMRTKNGQK